MRAHDNYSRELGELELPRYSNSELAALQLAGMNGDKEAYDALWLHGIRMVTKICKRLRDLGIIYAEDWEDAVQVGNLAIGEALPNWSSNMGRYSTYVWTCIRNAVVDFSTEQRRGGVTGSIDWEQFERRNIEQTYRSKGAEYLITDVLGETHDGSAAAFAPILDLAAAIEQLPDNQRYILRKYYFEDQGDPEIGVLLGISKQAVGKHRRQALDALQVYFS